MIYFIVLKSVKLLVEMTETARHFWRNTGGSMVF
jgi:hypothetical protein